MASCRGCGSTTSYMTRTYEDGSEICDQCTAIRPTGVPDIYLGSRGGLQTDENLCDRKTGEPIPFSTKREKKAIMDKLKLVQHPSAERTHGARNEKYLKNSKTI